MKNKFKILYGMIAVATLVVMTIGTTYAYWTATSHSLENSLQTESTIYSISMNIEPLYHDFSVIPMNDEDVFKAMKNECRDKYNRGACSAYKIRVYDYNEDLAYISGIMDITTNNMENLSYMMLRESSTYDEKQCLEVDGVIYCITKDATPMGEGTNLSLGDSYDVSGMVETNFILVIWLTNLNESQNESDIGSFNAIITMQAGSGGEIKGSIASALQIEGSETVGD